MEGELEEGCRQRHVAGGAAESRGDSAADSEMERATVFTPKDYLPPRGVKRSAALQPRRFSCLLGEAKSMSLRHLQNPD